MISLLRPGRFLTFPRSFQQIHGRVCRKNWNFHIGTYTWDLFYPPVRKKLNSVPETFSRKISVLYPYSQTLFFQPVEKPYFSINLLFPLCKMSRQQRNSGYAHITKEIRHKYCKNEVCRDVVVVRVKFRSSQSAKTLVHMYWIVIIVLVCHSEKESASCGH